MTEPTSVKRPIRRDRRVVWITSLVGGLLFLFAPAVAFVFTEWYPLPWLKYLMGPGCMVWIAGIVGVPLAMMIVGNWAREPVPPTICAHCGCDLKGLESGLCPECGTTRDDSTGAEGR